AFSVVVVIHRSREELERLLGAIERHLDPAPELIVVDTGPTDGGADLARGAGAEVVELLDNPGFGAANNIGVDRATGEVTVLLNPDVELLDGGLADLAAIPRRREVLAVPRLLNEDGSVQRSAHPPPGRAAGLAPALVPPPLLPKPARLRAEPWRAERPREVGWAVAACLAARTATLRRLGPFDPAA